ncbi:UNVERIFIED_CONTAM: hypothetical protein K2H54_039675 [Gekko kuhli]
MQQHQERMIRPLIDHSRFPSLITEPNLCHAEEIAKHRLLIYVIGLLRLRVGLEGVMPVSSCRPIWPRYISHCQKCDQLVFLFPSPPILSKPPTQILGHVHTYHFLTTGKSLLHGGV